MAKIHTLGSLAIFTNMNKRQTEMEIRKVLAKLTEPSHIDKWFNQPMSLFNFRTPRELIEAHRGQEILDMLKKLPGSS
jgi:hypothetical protein